MTLKASPLGSTAILLPKLIAYPSAVSHPTGDNRETQLLSLIHRFTAFTGDNASGSLDLPPRKFFARITTRETKAKHVYIPNAATIGHVNNSYIIDIRLKQFMTAHKKMRNPC